MATSAETLAPTGATGQPAGRPPRGLGRVLDRPVLLVFLVALLVRVTLALIIWQRYGGALFGDDLTYPQLARAQADGSAGTWDAYTQYLYDSTRALTLPLTWLYEVFGASVLVGQLWVSLFGAATAAAAAKVAGLAWGRSGALVAGLAVALLPSQVLWSSLTLKDAVVWAALAGIAVCVTVAARATSWSRYGTALLSAAALLFALAYLRQHTLVVACFAFAIASWSGPARGRLRRGVAALLLLLVIPWATGTGPAGWDLVSSPGSLEQRRANNAANAATAFVPDATGAGPEEIAAQVEARRRVEADRARALEQAAAAERARRAAEEARVEAEARAVAGDASAEAKRAAAEAEARARAAEELARLEEQRAAAAERAAKAQERAAESVAAPKPGIDEAFGDADASGSGDSLEGNLRQLPKGLSVMLLEPYPWVSTGNSHVDLVRYEMLLWYPLLALGLVGLVRFRGQLHVALFPLLVGGGIAAMYALAEGNFGTAFRHRGELVWVVAVLAAAGASSLTAAVRRR